MLLNIFIKNKLFRNASSDELMSIDQEGNQKKFSVYNDSEKDCFISKVDIITPGSKKTFSPASFPYWEHISPIMIQKGFLKSSDFSKTMYGSQTYDLFGDYERKLKPNSPYTHFSNNETSAKYFLGRTTFPGTNIKIDHDSMVLKKIDENTVGLINTIHDKRQLLFTFPLINKKEYENKKRLVIEKFKKEGRNIPEKSIHAYLTVGYDEMIDRIQLYKITDILKQKQNESVDRYAERIARFSDVGYLLDEFPRFAGKLGIGIHKLSWREQIILTDALTTVKNKEILSDFIQKFSITGIKTFLSVEHGGQEMGQKIIELGNVLEKQDAQRIFDGYAAVINQADQLQSKLELSLKTVDSIDSNIVEKLPHQLYDALLLRAKDVLVGAYMVATGTIEGKLDIDGVCHALSGITKILSIINDLGDDQQYQFKKTMETDQNHKYIVTDPVNHYEYGLKIFLRPRAEKNAQARVNLELSFDSNHPDPVLQKAFYNETVSHTQNKTSNGSVLRIGIDREDFQGTEQISLDLGRSEHTDTELTRTGDVLGNLLSYASLDGHHTTQSFSPEFAIPENFAKLVDVLGTVLIKKTHSLE
jgi:hypothetical protein